MFCILSTIWGALNCLNSCFVICSCSNLCTFTWATHQCLSYIPALCILLANTQLCVCSAKAPVTIAGACHSVLIWDFCDWGFMGQIHTTQIPLHLLTWCLCPTELIDCRVVLWLGEWHLSWQSSGLPLLIGRLVAQNHNELYCRKRMAVNHNFLCCTFLSGSHLNTQSMCKRKQVLCLSESHISDCL